MKTRELGPFHPITKGDIEDYRAGAAHANPWPIVKCVHTSQEHMDREMMRLDSGRAVGPLSHRQNGEETEKCGDKEEAAGSNHSST